MTPAPQTTPVAALGLALADKVERIAFLDMGAPNPFTPRLIQAVTDFRAALAAPVGGEDYAAIAQAWEERYSRAGAVPPPYVVGEEAGGFRAWWSKNVPSGTVISSPDWWAVRIERFMRSAPAAPVAGDVPKVLRDAHDEALKWSPKSFAGADAIRAFQVLAGDYVGRLLDESLAAPAPVAEESEEYRQGWFDGMSEAVALMHDDDAAPPAAEPATLTGFTPPQPPDGLECARDALRSKAAEPVAGEDARLSLIGCAHLVAKNHPEVSRLILKNVEALSAPAAPVAAGAWVTVPRPWLRDVVAGALCIDDADAFIAREFAAPSPPVAGWNNADVATLIAASHGLKFDWFKITDVAVRAAFGGKANIFVVDMESAAVFRDALSKFPAASLTAPAPVAEDCATCEGEFPETCSACSYVADEGPGMCTCADDPSITCIVHPHAADHAAPAARPSGEVTAKVPRVQATAPERIWLAVADEAYYADQPFPGEMSEICWSSDAPLEVCVPYVRADLATPLLAALSPEGVES